MNAIVGLKVRPAGVKGMDEFVDDSVSDHGLGRCEVLAHHHLLPN